MFILVRFALSLSSIEIRDESSLVLERTYEIKETIYDTDLDYTNTSKPFLALGTNGSVETVNKDFVFFFSKMCIELELVCVKSLVPN